MRTRLFLSVVLLALVAGAASAASAAISIGSPPTSFTLSGTFDDGGTFSGTLTGWTFSPRLSTGSWDITTGVGGGGVGVTYTTFYDKFEYTPSSSSLSPVPTWSGSDVVLTFQANSPVSGFRADGSYNRYLVLAFDPSNLGYVGGTAAFDTSQSYEHDDVRYVTSGNITAVPEPSSLLLLGSGAAGLAAVVRRRLLG